MKRKMPGRRCAVFCCNSNKAVSKARGEDIIFHSFPKAKDLVGTRARHEWIRNCKRTDNMNPDTSQICSKHFTEQDYERDLRNELLGLPVRRKLKRTAVPTLNLPEGENKQVTARYESLLCEKRKEVPGILEESCVTNKASITTTTDECDESDEQPYNTPSIPTTTDECDESDEQHYNKPSVPTTTDECGESDEQSDTTDECDEQPYTTDEYDAQPVIVYSEISNPMLQYNEVEYDELLNKYNQLKRDYVQMKHAHKHELKSLRDNRNYYKKKCLRNQTKTENARDILRTIFTDNQIAIVLNKKRRVNWTNEEITTALKLCYYSKRSYLYIKNNLHYPLPGLSTLRKWAADRKLNQEILRCAK